MTTVNIYQKNATGYELSETVSMTTNELISHKMAQIGNNEPDTLYVPASNKLANQILQAK